MTISNTKHILLKRGNTSISSSYIGPLGEVTIDTGLHTLRVHDGSTPGGAIIGGGADSKGATGIQGNVGIQGNIGITGATGIQGNIGSTGIQGNIGATGIQGNVGSTGIRGNIGSTGIQGNVGSTGIRGNIGSTGIQGNIGSTGATGIQGNIGSTGATGIQGNIGSTGATGIQGNIGITGATGMIGATGATGIQGNVGITGATGIIGSTGATGTAGHVGSTGFTGNIGATGLKGDNGAVGATGIQGNVGITGATGIEGNVGPRGFTGNQGVSVTLQGTQATITSLSLITGLPGHGWIVTTGDGVTHLNGSLWFWNVSSSSWNDIGPIVGPQGDVGNVGPRGVTGNIGSTGATGIQGNIGITGATGLQGNVGAVGRGIATGGAEGQVLTKLSSDDYDTGWVDDAKDRLVTGNVSVILEPYGNLTVPGHILPISSLMYDLGSPDARFRDLWLSGNSINIGNNTISTTAAGITMGNLEINGVIDLKPLDKIDTILRSTTNLVFQAGATGMHQWTFGADGTTTFPENAIKNNNSIYIIPGTLLVPDVDVYLADDGGAGGAWRLFIDDMVYPTIGDDVSIGSTVTVSWGTQLTATILYIEHDIGFAKWKFTVNQDVAAGFTGGTGGTATFGVGQPIWTFGTDGTLTLPNILTSSASTAYINFDGGQGGGELALGTNDGSLVAISTDGGATQWEFGNSGNLTLPQGGVISEVTVAPPGTNPSVGILLTPFVNDEFGIPSPDMAVKIYPTFNDDDHIHITAGNIATVDLFLGDDDQYVKIQHTTAVYPGDNDIGGVVIGTNADTHNWTFGIDGTLTIPGRITTPGGSVSHEGNGTNLYIGAGPNFGCATVSGSTIIHGGHGDWGGSGPVQIQTGSEPGNPDITQFIYTWNFDGQGRMRLPNAYATGGTLMSQGGFSLINSDIFQTPHLDTANIIVPSNSSTDPIQVNNNNGDIKFTSNTNAWTLGVNGTLTFPDSTIQYTAWQSAVMFGVTAPTTTENLGRLWYNSTDGRTYVMYNDTWVDANPPVVPAVSTYLDGIVVEGTTITTASYDATDIKIHDLTFTADGRIQLPVGGDIIDSLGNSVLENINSTDRLVNDNYSLVLGADGALTLSQDSIISEVSMANGLTGIAIALTPNGGTSATQQLLVYPTANNDANHLHLTSGDLRATELFLGDDLQYVKLDTDGGVAIATYWPDHQPENINSTWIFGKDGVLTMPDGNNGSDGRIDFNFEGYNWGRISSHNRQVYIQSVSDDGPDDPFKGNIFTELSVGLDVIVSTNVEGTGHSAYSWVFGLDGGLRFPDYTTQTTAWQGSAVVSESAPTDALGRLWYNTTDGRTYIKFNNTWVDANPPVVPPVSTYLSGLTIDEQTISSADYLQPDIKFAGNLIPENDLAYNLGSITNQWNSLYIKDSTIYMSGRAVSLTDEGLKVDGQSPISVIDGGFADSWA